MLAAILRSYGSVISYIDCLDRFHARSTAAGHGMRHGRGPYQKKHISNPHGLEDIPRKYARYGIKPEWFRHDLRRLQPPDLILVTSMMTYWYPGVQETIQIIRKVFPAAPIVLGGIYATLCFEHAVAHAGADQVVKGGGENSILTLAKDYADYAFERMSSDFDVNKLDTYPYPAFDLQPKPDYIPLLTSMGCPFSCSYCASHLLNPKQMRRSPRLIVAETEYWHKKFAVTDFAIYDDAFLFEAEKHALPLLEGIIRAGLRVRFHTPNALHIRWISQETARLMFKAGFETVRLGLETGLFEDRAAFDKKVGPKEFMQAVSFLKAAGFSKKQLGAYLLVGLPDQPIASVEASIHIVKQAGITPVLAYYSPIPGTALWNKAVAASRYDLNTDPIFTNNAIMPCQKEPFSWKMISHLKSLAA